MTTDQQEAAETQALDVLRFLAERPDDFARFLATSGQDPDDLAAMAGSGDFLAAMMDFVRSEEELAAAYCEEAGLTPEAFAALRSALPGGDETHWT